jgi:hypothetical protein
VVWDSVGDVVSIDGYATSHVETQVVVQESNDSDPLNGDGIDEAGQDQGAGGCVNAARGIDKHIVRAGGALGEELPDDGDAAIGDVVGCGVEARGGFIAEDEPAVQAGGEEHTGHRVTRDSIGHIGLVNSQVGGHVETYKCRAECRRGGVSWKMKSRIKDQRLRNQGSSIRPLSQKTS